MNVALTGMAAFVRCAKALCTGGYRLRSWRGLMAVVLLAAVSQSKGQTPSTPTTAKVPPRVIEAQRFLAERGWTSKRVRVARTVPHPATVNPEPAIASSGSSAVWQPLGPVAVASLNYGLVTGRVSSIVFDPADPTGNRVYVGTTGGGVWVAQNAGTSSGSSVVFTPLTDTLSALSGARDASISIGALTVQPGGTGVILAGTGDPNDALDSYYGAGILRSADGGNSWSLVQLTVDQMYSFVGEGFAGFAWSTVNPQLVVAAVSQAYEGTLVNAERTNLSYDGLYYSADGGTTWSLARITDGANGDVQGPADLFAVPNGNAATAVVWNQARGIFIAAVRYHGYYQSTDGMTWTRLAAQPGAGLTAQMCPANYGSTGSEACPIFRGALAVNPSTGDTFAWTVDLNNQDQGIWQDQCALSSGTCSNPTVAFSSQLDTSPLEVNTAQGEITIANGDYNLALAAIPSQQDTLLLAGANDVWRCSLAAGCVWRNTTNTSSCMSAQVGEYQHALTWNGANPLEVFIGNDSGLWRSTDAIGEAGTVCAASDASHFQNLNGGLGSLAEVASMSQITTSPYTMMTGLGANGTAGTKGTTAPTTDWPEILSGEGGPVAIDPVNASNWYVNNEAGVSIFLCAQTGSCTAGDFGSAPVVNDADVGGDGYTMATPAPFIVDPLDSTQLLVGTCRVWRGPADGSEWSGANAISPMLDGVAGNNYCSGDALIRTVAAMPLANGSEVIYAGMYGALDGGTTVAGQVLKATFDPASSSMPSWRNLTLNPVTNDLVAMNYLGLDISTIFIDPHDASGNTVYVTVEGIPDPTHEVRTLYRSTDGGAHWAEIVSNLPSSPANSVVVDPLDANTVYVATDDGVYSTRQIANCAAAAANCWSAYGTGLPHAPVVQLSAAPATASLNVLAAATYGRGVWQIPLWTAGTQLTTASASPVSLTFASQNEGSTSSAQTVILTNTGGITMSPAAIVASGDFSETDECVNSAISAGQSCSIQVSFTPTQTGDRTGQLTISANIAGGQLVVALHGAGVFTGVVSLAPSAINFGQVQVGTTSAPLQVTVGNAGTSAIPLSAVSVTAPFVLASNACGTSVPAGNDCQLTVEFLPTQGGTASGTLTLTDGSDTQSVALTGTGATAATDSLSPASLNFPSTASGQLSTALGVVLTNKGDLPLNSISTSVSAGFQTTNNCGGSLDGHASCTISVVFAPSQVGSLTGTLSVIDATQTQAVALAGIGLQPAALSVSPLQLVFPVLAVGTASSPLTLTISNSGGAQMANIGLQINGQAASSFSTGTNTCGSTLSKGSSCSVQIIFTPAAAGADGAVLTVTSSTLGVSPVQVPLSGIGQEASGLTVSPAQLVFTEATLGQASALQTATISNTSNATANGLAIGITTPFSVTQNSCGSSLAAGASCTVGVVFTPSANGTVAGVLTVRSSAFTTASTLALSGTGGAAGSVQLQPGSLSFSTTGVGLVSSSQMVALTNSSAVSLTNFALSVSSGFQLTGNTCGSSLAPAATCTAAVAFAPANLGQQTGNLSVSSSMLAASAQVALSGTGFDFSVTFSGGSAQTVSSGQTALYTLVLTPAGGTSATFTFSCGTLPENATCAFSPASELVAGSATGNVTVKIATGVAATSSQSLRVSRIGNGFSVLPAACAMIILPLAWGRWRRKILLAMVFSLLAISITSCAGAGGGSGPVTPPTTGNNTPAGTYSIPVTISANGVSHSITLSLTVD